MSGCSLHEAFPDTAKQSGQTARKEERAKAKRCPGPALSFLKAGGEDNPILDPDRQHMSPLPPSEKLQGMEAFTTQKAIEGYVKKANSSLNEGFSSQDNDSEDYRPIRVSDADRNDRELVKNLTGQRVDDVIGQKSRKSLPRSAMSPAQVPDSSHTQYGSPVPSYFGKGLADKASEGWADYSNSMADNPGYQIQGADFAGSFGKSGLDNATGKSLPTPSISNTWKPLTPSGVNTIFFDELPASASASAAVGGVFSRDEKQSLLNKLDTLFARLEELESKRNEYAHAEVTMFILSGLVLMFGLETVRKLR